MRIVARNVSLPDAGRRHPVHHVEGPAVVRRLGLDEIESLRDLVRRGQERPPPRGIFGRPAQRRVHVTADPDGKVWLLERFGFECDTAEGYIPALETWCVTGPQLDDGGQVFVGDAAALAKRYTEQLELALQPAHAEGDHHPPTAHP